MQIKKLPYIKSIEYSNSAKNYGYPFNIPLFKKCFKIYFNKNITFLVGENASGKSTLIEALAKKIGLSEQGGTKNFNLKDVNDNNLEHFLDIKKSPILPKDYFFLRSESFFNLATYMDDVNYLNGYGGKSLHKQSHGESFLSVIKNKLKGNGVYLMDEPESALSPENQLKFISYIHQISKLDSQFIIVTHSPILLAYPDSEILEIENDEIKSIAYENTNQYLFYKKFMQNYNDLYNRIIYELN